VSKATLAVRFLLKHWDREKRPYTPDLNGCNDFSERRFRLRPPYGDMMQFVAVPTTDTSTYCGADTDGPLQYGIEHRLYVGRRPGDTRSTSAVAVCCSSSSFRSRMSRSISVSWVSLPIEDRVWVGLRRAVALATCGLPTCLLTACLCASLHRLARPGQDILAGPPSMPEGASLQRNKSGYSTSVPGRCCLKSRSFDWRYAVGWF